MSMRAGHHGERNTQNTAHLLRCRLNRIPFREQLRTNFMSGQIQRRFMASYLYMPSGEPRADARSFSNRRL